VTKATRARQGATTVAAVAAAVESLAPLGHAASWDRSGLRIGDPNASVSSVLVALSLTAGAYEAAKAVGAQLLVTHHPPVWEPLTTLRMDDAETRLWVRLAADGIACYAAHTNLDVAPGGVNDVLAERLGLDETRVLFPAREAEQVKLVTFVPQGHLAAVRAGVCEAGAGVIGDYTYCTFSTEGVGTFLPGEGADPFAGRKGRVNEEPERKLEVLVPKARLGRVLRALFEAHPYEEVAYDVFPLVNRDERIGLGRRGRLPEPMPLGQFAERVCERLDTPHVRVTGPLDRTVSSVAVLGGAGGGQLGRVPGGVDVTVTGDVGYHDAASAVERGQAVIDAGHAATEKWVVPALQGYLERRLPDVRFTAFDEPELFHAVTRRV
jgi:dinuclear metal center YbgI/SA1388 family protein